MSQGDVTVDRPILEVSNLAAGYGDIRAVWDVSLFVRAGQLTAVLGRNGAGKTTALRAIAGVNKVDQGSIIFNGHEISTLSAHLRVSAGIGLVQDGKRVLRRLTVHQNLMLGGYSLANRRRRLDDEVSRAYEIFPALKDRARVVAGQLSGGQQQMLAIGQALVARPSVIMLDEPSAGLAPAIVGDVMEALARLKDHGLGVILVEQQVEAAIAVADHVVVLDVGRVIMSSPARDVADLEILKQAYFGSAKLIAEQIREEERGPES